MKTEPMVRAVPDRWSSTIVLVLAFVFAAAGPVTGGESDDWRHDGAGFEEIDDPARALFELPQPWLVLSGEGKSAAELLDAVVTLHHDVPIGNGRTLRVNEHFTLRSWLRWPKRAVLLLTGSIFRGSSWSIPVPGYNATELAARRGMFAYTCDYIGIGDSYHPEDGLESTFAANLEAIKAVLRYIRFFRAVPRIDLVGESWGGVHAIYLAADPTRVRTCVVSSMGYKSVAKPEMLAPEFVAILQTMPNNYLPMRPEDYETLTTGAHEDVAEFLRTTQPGLYLTTHLWQGIQQGLPHFDPSVARVPGLVIYGSKDRPEDGEALAADYGTAGAELLIIEGADHGPRFEAPEIAQRYWTKVFGFIDPRQPPP